MYPACVHITRSKRLLQTSISMQIAENGAITFDGDSWSFNQPRVFPNTLLTIRDRYVLAPFWADHDLQTSGSVEYQIFQRQIDSSDNETLLNVSIFIRKQFPDASDYLGIWMLVVNWIAIPPCGDPTSVSTDLFLNNTLHGGQHGDLHFTSRKYLINHECLLTIVYSLLLSSVD